MKIIRLDDGATAIYRCLDVLRDGGIIAHPTETCYGFACDLANLQAVKKLFALKNRPDRQPISALFPSIEIAKKYVEWNDAAQIIAQAHLPGPLTIILKLRTDAPHKLYATPYNTDTIGIRISSNPFTMMLAEDYPFPLSTTSANIHHEPEAYDAKDIIDRFRTSLHQPDMIIDGGAIAHTKPSTIVDCTDAKPRIIRQGDLHIKL